jgi:glyoxylase-like metal-dependent hydrolase (beta-lactamase superfamily II)
MLAAVMLVEEPVRIWRCPLPLPNALKAVNGYVMIGATEVVLVDPGLRNDQTVEMWERHLAALGLNWDAVTDVVVTHYHPDHSGMAGWIGQRTVANLWMSRQTATIMQAMWGRPWSELEFPQQLIRLFVSHGLPQEWEERFDLHFASFQPMVSPLPDWERIKWLEAGGRIHLAGLEWELIAAEGHASGQMMLWHEAGGLIFCADHVLPDISPNITVLAGDDPQPLETFLADLRKVMDLPVAMALPGHRGVIRRWRERISELLEHHDHRLIQLEQLVVLHGPVQAWTLVPLLYQNIRTDQQMRFALAEMIAHLWWLVAAGRISMEQDNAGGYWFCAVAMA